MKRARYLHLLATVVLGLTAATASAGIRSERLLATILKRTPAAMLVSEGQELATAEKHAAALPRAQAFLGVGSSMEPLYAPNTAVVVQEIDYDDIAKGMTVVYVSRHGHRVAHTVVGETRGGFIMQGVNNDQEDAELLTAQNYVGVVVDAYASADSQFRADLTERLVAKGRLDRRAVARI
jgi:signal peptidase I